MFKKKLVFVTECLGQFSHTKIYLWIIEQWSVDGHKSVFEASGTYYEKLSVKPRIKSTTRPVAMINGCIVQNLTNRKINLFSEMVLV